MMKRCKSKPLHKVVTRRIPEIPFLHFLRIRCKHPSQSQQVKCQRINRTAILGVLPSCWVAGPSKKTESKRSPATITTWTLKKRQKSKSWTSSCSSNVVSAWASDWLGTLVVSITTISTPIRSSITSSTSRTHSTSCCMSNSCCHASSQRNCPSYIRKTPSPRFSTASTRSPLLPTSLRYSTILKSMPQKRHRRCSISRWWGFHWR